MINDILAWLGEWWPRFYAALNFDDHVMAWTWETWVVVGVGAILVARCLEYLGVYTADAPK